jgi:PAS domain-containing protein
MKGDPHSQLSIEIQDKQRPPQAMEDIGLGDACLLDALAQFDLYGVWRIDLETGMVYWSRDVFEIYGIPYHDGPVDIRKAIEAYHPDDRALVSSCIEEAAARKTGYRFVLRLQCADGGFKLVKSSGRYRVNQDGREEIFGTFSQFHERVRAVAVIA